MPGAKLSFPKCVSPPASICSSVLLNSYYSYLFTSIMAYPPSPLAALNKISGTCMVWSLDLARVALSMLFAGVVPFSRAYSAHNCSLLPGICVFCVVHVQHKRSKSCARLQVHSDRQHSQECRGPLRICSLGRSQARNGR